VGGEVQGDPRNPRSLYRHRYFVPREHYSDHKWHTAQIAFDFRKLPRAFYSIFAPRINEGVNRPAPAILRVVRVRVWSR
jgi:hypothetical protein